MRKLVTIVVAALALLVGTFAPAFAHGGGNDFVQPVFQSHAVGWHNPNAQHTSSGRYKVVPVQNGNGQNADIRRVNHVDASDQATNDNSAGSPSGSYLMPGDPGYTAIWNGD